MAPKKPGERQRVAGALAFFEHEAAGGIVLLAAAVLALILANSPAEDLYDALLKRRSCRSAHRALAKPLLHWINDGLMAVFFLLVGLEIKRELVDRRAVDRREQARCPSSPRSAA